MAPVSFALLTAMVGCGTSEPSAVTINLVSAPSKSRGEDHVVVHLVQAEIDGRWRTLSSFPRALSLSRGAFPGATQLITLAPPPGHLAALRIEVSDAAAGELGRRFRYEAACDQTIPTCADGSATLELDDPGEAARGGGKHALRLVSMNTVTGTCPPPADPDLATKVDAATSADLSPDPRCVGVVCAPDQICVAGICQSADPCSGVVCPPQQVCIAGQCVPPPDMSTPPDLSRPVDLSEPSCDHSQCNHGSCGAGGTILH